MKLTATEFRKGLFPLLERALCGESVEVVYKGAIVKLVPSQSSSKLARAKRQTALLCDPDSIVNSDKELLADMEAEWREGWKRL
ncbi:MAG: hypothetical protein ABSG25_01170 [Bryobacteraceae bacterium]|jgi:antitoxin (DNA-binding transcriptional repressor) of toxin-antitoxin stability system